MKLLPLTIVRQTPGYCGPSCLRMIFAYYGVRVSEATIARAARTTRALGSTLAGMKDAAASFGFRAVHQDDASFDVLAGWLKKRVPVIVNWFFTDDGHFSVVVGLDAKYIYLADPHVADVIKMERKVFRRVWFDFTGDYYLKKKKSPVCFRRLIVAMPVAEE